MTIAPNRPQSQPAKHGGPVTSQASRPDLWELLDRLDVQTFIAYERHCAYADGVRDGTNQEYARWQLIPLALQQYNEGWHDAREYYQRTGRVPHTRLRPAA